MTLPYNASASSQTKYLVEDLHAFDCDKETKIMWYSGCENNSKPRINSRGAYLVVSSIKYVIHRDFEKINKLSKYLKNIAKLLNILELPITCRLPTGLTVIQSYMQTITTSITPFAYSKTRLNINTRTRNYNNKKQALVLMLNLIHSLDATSMYLLYKSFSKIYPECQFFSVHDCFGTITDKVVTLKIILASVYTDLYSDNHYLTSFDDDTFKSLNDNRGLDVNKAKRTVILPEGTIFAIHDIHWVVGEKPLNKYNGFN